MNGNQKAALRSRILAADAATQMGIAEAIRMFPNYPHYGEQRPVMENPEYWAEVHGEAKRLSLHAVYVEKLSWFYANARPLNAMEMLLDAKLDNIPKGHITEEFWDYMGRAPIFIAPI